MNAGTALELAIKARLTRHGIAFIAPDKPGWFIHLDRLLKSPDLVGVDGPQTISGQMALARLLILEPDIAPDFGAYVRETIDRCNMVKHLGLASAPDEDQRSAEAAAFVTAIETLIKPSPEAFWGEQSEVAKKLVSDAHDATAIRVATAVAIATKRMNALGQSLAILAAAELETIDKTDALDFADFAEIACPVCKSPGRAYGQLYDDGYGEADADSDGADYYWVPRIVNIVEHFECAVCGLELTGGDEILESDLPSIVDNSRADPEMVLDLDGI